jgi:hypothetical protein
VKGRIGGKPEGLRENVIISWMSPKWARWIVVICVLLMASPAAAMEPVSVNSSLLLPGPSTSSYSDTSATAGNRDSFGVQQPKMSSGPAPFGPESIHQVGVHRRGSDTHCVRKVVLYGALIGTVIGSGLGAYVAMRNIDYGPIAVGFLLASGVTGMFAGGIVGGLGGLIGCPWN